MIADKITALPPAKELKLPAQKPVVKSASTPKPAVEKSPAALTLYLKVPSLDCRAYRKAKNLLEIFHGSTRVVFYLSESRQQMLAPRSLWASPNPTMLGELKVQLGEGNVRLK